MIKSFSKQDYQRRVETARWTLLIFSVLTILNVFLLAFSNDEYFITGSSIAIHIVTIGKIFCGKMSTSFYVDKWSNVDFLSIEFLLGMLAIALVIGTTLLLVWYLSKKTPMILLVPTIFIFIDTVCMFFVYKFTFMTYCDLAIHILSFAVYILSLDAVIKIKRFSEQEKALIASIHHNHKFYN